MARSAPQKAARGRERDFLFCHLTLTGEQEKAAALAEELTEALSRRFFAAPGSVTSAMRRAIIETNEQLLRHNLASRASHEGALTCAVLHKAELYTLQVGEGLAFVGHNFGVERLPARPPAHLVPLGRSAGIDIRFAFHQLQVGDMMLLCDPRLSYLSGEALGDVLVDTEIESGLESLMSLLTADATRLLLVEFTDELPSTLPLTFQHSKQPAPRAAARKPAAAPGPAAAIPSVPAPVRPGQSVPVATQATADQPLETFDETSPLETSARRVASSSARGLSRFTGWLAAVLGLLGRERSEEPSVHWAIPATIAMIIPLVIGAVLAGVYLQRDTVAQVSAIKQQMIAELAAAESGEAGSTEVQAHYLQVLALAGEADELRPDDPEVARMRSDALNALDRIDGVSRLTAASFYRHEPGSNLTRLALRAAGGVAVLDQTTNRVFFHITEDDFSAAEEPQTIAFGGQSIGANVVGILFDIHWIPGSAATTRDSIGMLDTSGAIFNYHPNLGDIASVLLANSSNWDNPIAMATYLDRLYVLDIGAQEIWKYYGSSGYQQIEDDVSIEFTGEVGIDQIGLDQAVDIDLYSGDGSLVVLYGDGRIRYHSTPSGRVLWDETTLAQGGLVTPLIAPVAVKIVGSGLNASIFVLDPGSGRIVQISRGGTVLSQYRLLDSAGNDVISKSADFAVVESPLSFFVVAGDQIYLTAR